MNIKGHNKSNTFIAGTNKNDFTKSNINFP